MSAMRKVEWSKRSNTEIIEGDAKRVMSGGAGLDSELE